MILKTTLHRANPAVIREFYIENERTVGELLAVIAILHGWAQDSPLRLFKGSARLNPSLKIEMLGKGVEEITVRMPMQQRTGYFSNTTDKPEEWIFWLDVIDNGAGKEKKDGPKLLRYRGMNPPLSCNTLQNWNSMHRNVIRSGRHYFGYSRKETNRDSFLVDQKKTNRLLHQRIVLHQEEIRLNRACCHNFEDILNSYTVDELKTMIRDKMWTVGTNQRKRNLIESIMDEYQEEDIWKNVLNEMDIDEYTSFQKLCRGVSGAGETGIYDYPVLFRYCLLDRHYGFPFIPNELIDYYETFLMEEGEDKLVYRKKIRKVIEAASNLYGVFTKAMCKQLAVVMYPKDIKPGDISLEWKESDFLRRLNNFTLYNARQMDVTSARNIMNDPALETIGYYIPSKGEAFLIADGKINYPMEEQKILRRCLSQFKFSLFYYEQNKDYLINRTIRGLYDMSHLGIDSGRMKKYLKDSLYLEGTAAQFKQLLGYVDKFRARVRSVDFHGYTQEEIRRKTNNKR